jgi:hypothetical protein
MDGKEYLDAKFEGLEKLMAAQDNNIRSYIASVHSRVKEVSDDLKEHAESSQAHGLGVMEKDGHKFLSWGGFVTGAIAAIVALWKHG